MKRVNSQYVRDRSPVVFRLVALAAAIVSVLLFSDESKADNLPIKQRLSVELIPSESKLKGKVELLFGKWEDGPVEIGLAEHARVRDIRIQGEKTGNEFSDGVLSVRKPAGGMENTTVEFEYEAVFDDPAPSMPANMDNPGFGVAGTIGDQGVFLLSGSGWHPRVLEASSSYYLEVKAPQGTIAVTAGKYLGSESAGEHTISRWEIEKAPEGLALSAAQYEVRRQKAGDIDIMTFFLPQSQDLAQSYLDATERYIQDYSRLFGPYPFEKFAVVENFFPTGYGFPSYTLLGTRVLRLPFIIHTSLGHEIAHCWWGNGVLPDYSQGNWSEGLTSYVADYLFKERESAEEAREHRLQWLRNYAALVRDPDDFPVAKFTSRVDPVTKAVGYDKAAMFFHMLRKKVGDDIFWQGLREMYRDFLFETASWKDFEDVYERLAGEPLDDFFAQWILRKGGPTMALANVSSESSGRTVKVNGAILQEAPFYDMDVDILLETDNSRLIKTVSARGKKTLFEFSAEGAPVLLQADPAVDIFRRLYKSEIPPTVNSLKSSRFTVAAIGGDGSKKLRSSAVFLMRSLGIDRFEVMDEKNMEANNVAGADILWVGLPSNLARFANVPETARLANESFRLDGVAYDGPNDVFFGVFPRPGTEDRVTGLFLPLSEKAVDTAIRKITHYGKYSYLAFSDGQNRDKGTWRVEKSPLIHRFGQKQTEANTETKNHE